MKRAQETFSVASLSRYKKHSLLFHYRGIGNLLTAARAVHKNRGTISATHDRKNRGDNIALTVIVPRALFFFLETRCVK